MINAANGLSCHLPFHAILSPENCPESSAWTIAVSRVDTAPESLLPIRIANIGRFSHVAFVRGYTETTRQFLPGQTCHHLGITAKAAEIIRRSISEETDRFFPILSSLELSAVSCLSCNTSHCFIRSFADLPNLARSKPLRQPAQRPVHRSSSLPFPFATSRTLLLTQRGS